LEALEGMVKAEIQGLEEELVDSKIANRALREQLAAVRSRVSHQ